MDDNNVLVVDDYKFTVGEAKLFRKMFIQLAMLYLSRKEMDKKFKDLINYKIGYPFDNDGDDQYIDNFLRKRTNFVFDDDFFKLHNKTLSTDSINESVAQVSDLLITWNAKIDGLYITNSSIVTICAHYYVDRLQFKTYLETPLRVKDKLVELINKD